MPYAGDLQITVEMTSNVGAGVAATKAQLGQLDGSVKESSNQMNILDAATGKNARGIKSMGTVAMMGGGPLMMMGMSMKEAGGEAEKLSSVVTSAGVGLTAFGMVAMVLPPIIRSIGFVHSAIIPAIMAQTGATVANTAATAAETVVIGSNIAAKAVEVTLSETIATATAQVAAANVAAMTTGQLAAASTLQLATTKTAVLVPAIAAEVVAESGAVASTIAMAGAEAAAVVPTVALAAAVDLLKVAVYGLVGGIIVGGLIAAYAIYSNAQEVSKKATEEHTQALKDQKTAQDELKQSLASYNSLVDEYNNKDVTARELKNSHTAAVLNLQSAIKKAGQSGTPENLLAVSDAENRVIRTKAAMEKGAARETALPGLINEAATKATAADSEAQNKAIIAANITTVEKKWEDYRKTQLFGIMTGGDSRRMTEELNKARMYPGVNVAQVPLMPGGLPTNPAPTAIHIQNLTVGSIGETPIGDTGYMLKVERKRAV